MGSVIALISHPLPLPPLRSWSCLSDSSFLMRYYETNRVKRGLGAYPCREDAGVWKTGGGDVEMGLVGTPVSHCVCV